MPEIYTLPTFLSSSIPSQGNGLKGAVNLTGKGGNSMAKHMSSFSADATPRSKKAFFSRRKSGEMDSSR